MFLFKSQPPPLCLPQKTPQSQIAAREAQIEKAQRDYVPCTDGPGGAPTKRVPAYPKTVPWCEGINPINGDARDSMVHLMHVGITIKTHRMYQNAEWKWWQWRGQHAEPFGKHTAIMKSDVPWPAKDNAWRSDYEWGYQRLNGMIPFLVRRCDAIPDTMAAQLAANSGAALAGMLPPGETLESLVKAKRIFIVDHSDLVGCPHHEGRYLCASRTLFLATGANDTQAPALPGETIPPGPRFRPIAIQLAPEAAAPVITPVHPPVPGLWLATRLHAGVSDAAVQIFFEHVVTMHLCNEAFWMCMCRTMADQHPLKQILKPHMHVTIYMGAEFRDTTYIIPNGSLPHLHACGVDGGYWIMEKKLETWKITDHDQNRFYKERGTDDLEGYTMRDDAKKHWDLILKYCRRVVDLIYPEQPTDIVRDTELQSFVNVLRSEGRLNGVPGEVDETGKFIITKAEDVVMLLAIPIFAGAIKHSLVDNAAYTYYGFAPNVPLSFMLPPPVTHEALQKQVDAGGFTDDIISDHLQQGDDAVYQLSLVQGLHPIHAPRTLVDRFKSEIARNGKHWRGAGLEGVPQALETWVKGLDDLSKHIIDRNQDLKPRPYSFLEPRHNNPHGEGMSNSIWY